jgi:ADP-heptose:LPS heptosyltransferase
MCDHVHPCFPPWTKFKDKYLFWRSDWWKYLNQLRRLRSVQFDLLISIRYDPREILQLRLLKSRIRAAYSACGGLPWLDIDFGANPSMAQMKHVTYDATLAAEILTGQKPDPMPSLNVSSHNLSRCVEWLLDNGYRGGVVLTISSGAGNSVRRWPDDSYTEVLKDLPMSVGFIVVIAPPEGNDLINIQWPFSIPGAFWKGSLKDLQGILSMTDILLTVDSGIMHVGAACGCRIVSIFGPMLKQWFRPYTPASEIIMVDPMPCRPCFDKCIYDVPICMKNIKRHVVKETVHKAVAQIDNPRIKSFL